MKPGILRNRWWELDTDEVADGVSGVAQAILNQDAWRREAFMRYGKMYGGMGRLGDNKTFDLNRWPLEQNSPVRYSLVREVVDTLLSQLTISKPRAMPLTDAGDWSLQRKARLLGRYINGCMYGTKADMKMVSALKDALIFGTGILKVCDDGKKLLVDRVLPWEVVADEGDALYGEPQRLYQVRMMDRATLADVYGDVQAVEFAATDEYASGLITSERQASDLVSVYEAWSLPSSPGAKDGRHVICTSGGVLLDEKWDSDEFPFVILNMSEPLVGIWGSGVAEEVAPLEQEVNRIYFANQRSMQLFGVPQVWVEEGSKVNIAKLDNIPGRIYTYTGRPPIVVTNETVTKEAIDAIERYRASAFERFGANQMQGAGLKPAGLNSGVALRTWLDQGSTRLGPIQRKYEAACVELGRKLVGCARMLYDKYGIDYEATSPDAKFLHKIKWSEVDLEDSEFVMQVFPINLLAKEPGARLEQVNEMMASGLIDNKMALSLLQFPDIEAWSDMQNAPVEQIKMIAEQILEEGNYIGPTPLMDLEAGMQFMQHSLTKAEVDGAPEERLDLMRQWIEEAGRLLDMANPPAPPVPGAFPPEGQQMPPEVGTPPQDMGPPPEMPAEPGMEGMDPAMMEATAQGAINV